MNRRIDIIGLMLVSLLTVGCTAEDAVETDVSVATSLALAVSDAQTQAVTRVADAIVQEGSVRDIQSLTVIPFAVQGPVTQSDLPKLVDGSTIGMVYDHGDVRYYYRDKYALMQGVASCLVYGRAKPDGDDAVNGALTVTCPTDYRPSGITFSLKQRYKTAEADNKAKQLANYLTTIANTEGWSTTSDSHLQAYYQNFIGQGSVHPMVISGASANVKAYASQLKKLLEAELQSELRDAILANINNGYAALPTDYPACIGLPDGAAAVRWELKPGSDTEYAFVPQTSTTTEVPINSITRFAYPAELYYYANSRLYTSSLFDRSALYNKSTWAEVLAEYEYRPGVVTGNTQSVAVKETLQYAVARLDATVVSMGAALPDADGNAVTTGETFLPLTGIIVGGQRTAGFDFLPKDPSSDADMRFVYDDHIQQNDTPYYLSTTTSGKIHTLLLQNADNEDVPVILEFQNNTGKDFRGVGGVIYKGTKFYLVGKIPHPTPETDKDYTNRVFTKDYITTVNMKVESLAKAYNVAPNLLSPRLEIGVTLTTAWMAATPTAVKLE